MSALGVSENATAPLEESQLFQADGSQLQHSAADAPKSSITTDTNEVTDGDTAAIKRTEMEALLNELKAQVEELEDDIREACVGVRPYGPQWRVKYYFPQCVSLSELKVKMCKAAVDAACAAYLCEHPGSTEADANASTGVISKRQDLLIAEMDRDVRQAKLKVNNRWSEAGIIRHRHREEYNNSWSMEVSEAEVEIDIERSKLEVAEARAAFLHAHPGSSLTDVDTSVDVRRAMSMVEVETCRAGLLAAQITFLRANPGLSLSRADSKEIREKRQMLEEAKDNMKTVQRGRLAYLASFATDGLPGPRELPTGLKRHWNLTDSYMCPPKAHSLFSPLERDVPTLSSHRSMAWMMTAEDSPRAFLSQADFVTLVHEDAYEVAKACDAPLCVSRGDEIIDSNGRPVTPSLCIRFNNSDGKPNHLSSVIEVVEPDRVFDESHSSMTYLLAALRNSYGVSYPIGILTTHNEWQFCWPKYASPVAEATTLDQVRNLPPYQPIEGDLELCTSKVYKCQDPELKMLLVSFMLKVAAIPHGAERETWTIYTPQSITETFTAPAIEKLNLHRMVHPNDTEFLVAKFLGRGAEGSTLLMITTQEPMCCCVVKRCALPAWECKMWVAAYGKGCGVREVVLNEHSALLMPYYEPLSRADWKNSDTVKLVTQHVEALANRGVFHRDVKRRHVVWADEAKTDVRLIDWGRATCDSTMREKVMWAKNAKKAEKAKAVREYIEYAQSLLMERA